MRAVDLDAVARVARRLERLGIDHAFTGGAVVGLLLDNPELIQIRPTNDVDAIAAVLTRAAYIEMEERLRGLGFRHDTSEGAPVCRWMYEGIKVDVMPARDQTGQFADRWFEYALTTACPVILPGVTARVVRATSFVATKLTAFEDRGENDYRGSHDLEDVLTVVDGRLSLAAELQAERPDLRRYVGSTLRGLLSRAAFYDAIPGHLPPDHASQQRLPLLIGRLEELASLGNELGEDSPS